MDSQPIVDRICDGFYLTPTDLSNLRAVNNQFNKAVDKYMPELKWRCPICTKLHIDVTWKKEEFKSMHFMIAQSAMESILLDACLLILCEFSGKSIGWVIRKSIPFCINSYTLQPTLPLMLQLAHLSSYI